ncbi:MAG: helix-turn-helix transcriptional regulator [Verrucomicrobiota bacterium]
METLGNKLEEARKRKGVSLREAAEATKIRMEYLTRYESDDFDLPLPPIYQRGFIKIYARYLGEDPSAVADEVQARLHRTQAAQGRGDAKPSLGQMELGSKRKRAAAPISDAPDEEYSATPDEAEGTEKRWRLPQIRVPGLHSRGDDPEYDDLEETGEPMDRTFYLKVAVVVGSVTVAVVLLIALIKLISGGEETPLNPELSDSGSSAEIVGASDAELFPESADLTIRAVGGPTWIMVDDVASGETLERFSLDPGQSRLVENEGEVLVSYTQGEYLEVVRGGESYRPSRSGVGKIRIP